ncbi:FK506-binding protein 2-like isoform X2 [Anneissia japonica]|uniref:FK506-binding protein 2-like isoform X2 n=1 Tax=Anneissia japonica TaxID=1529436 RepID=UPI0014258B01|nr:FK506-binding protein 2-like isoform X2 [Anneissia japonica]
MAILYIFLQHFTLLLLLAFPSVVSIENEISIEILYRPADCEFRSKKGDLLVLHYIGINLEDGKQFDSSLESGHPKQVRLGQHLVMLGWEKGLEDMCIGEKREVTIPPGPLQKVDESQSNSGTMLPFKDMTAVYHFELLEIRDEAPRLKKFHLMDSNDDDQITVNEMVEYYIQQGSDELGPHLSLNDAVKTIFSYLDVNKDFLISRLEYIGKAHDEL